MMTQLSMMKSIARFMFILLVTFGAQAYSFANYGYKIFAPAKTDKQVTDAVNDMLLSMDKMGAGKFSLVQGTTATQLTGIQLFWMDDFPLTKKEKTILQGDGQSFYLVIEGNKRAQIVARTATGFLNGIYTFLQELGFRWYMPGEIWTITPGKINPQLRIKKTYTPVFRNRSYAGAGGISAVAQLDPKNTFRSDFEEWNRRNRWAIDYEVKSHSGQRFYTENKEVLDKNPAYFCNGKVNRNGWINIDNPAVVSLFVQWALRQIHPTYPYSVIGVDPSDGSGSVGDCLPANNKSVKTWSDKYYWLANKVAAAIPASDKNTLVQLYAYSNHSDTPGFAIHKRVSPVIIPYAFQEKYEPAEFVRLWGKKMKGAPMGIYDYWNITQWNKCLPDFDLYGLPAKLKLWKANGVATVHLESTYSKGSMGLPMWVASQLMWDAQLSGDKLQDEFFRNCFGNAAPPVRRMYNRWFTNFQITMEPAISARDLMEAFKLTNDSKVHARLTELGAYVQYMRLYYEYLVNQNRQNYERLMNHIFRIHDTRMLHTTALEKYYIPRPKDNQQARSAEEETAKLKTGVSKVDGNEVTRFLAGIDRDYPAAYNFSTLKIDPARMSVKTSAEVRQPNELIGKNRYLFTLKSTQTLKFDVTTNADTRFFVTDQSGIIRYSKWVAATGTKPVTLSVKLAAGTYTIQYGEVRRISTIRFPPGIGFLSGDHAYNNAGFPVLYFYVPRNATEIIYQDSYGPGTNRRGYFIDPSGKQAAATLMQPEIYRVPVSPEQRGKVWQFNVGHRSFKLLNIPDYFSLSPFSYTE